MNKSLFQREIFTIFLITWSLSNIIRREYQIEDFAIFTLAIALILKNLFFYKKDQHQESAPQIKSNMISKYFFFPAFYLSFVFYLYRVTHDLSLNIQIGCHLTGILIFATCYYYGYNKKEQLK